MEYAAESKLPEVAEELLHWFLERKNYTCFGAVLFQCYDLLHPDVVMELAWRHDIQQFAMPYFIQVLREYTTKVDELQDVVNNKLEESAQEQKTSIVYDNNPLMLTAGPGMAGGVPNAGYMAGAGPVPGAPGQYGYQGYGM